MGCLKLDMYISVATPNGYEPLNEVLKFSKNNPLFSLTNDLEFAVKNADVVITDTWTSMGQEEEKLAREKAFENFQVNEKLMSHAKGNAMVLHCLPAYREKEISSETLKKHSIEIYDEAENRLHAQKAVMVTLMK